MWFLKAHVMVHVQVIQLFDSWASHLSPRDFDTFAAPYTTRILADFKKTHPHVPTILYISGSGGLLERMAACKPDCLSIDGSVDLADAIKRCGTDFAYQGNIDPGCASSSTASLLGTTAGNNCWERVNAA